MEEVGEKFSHCQKCGSKIVGLALDGSVVASILVTDATVVDSILVTDATVVDSLGNKAGMDLAERLGKL